MSTLFEYGDKLMNKHAILHIPDSQYCFAVGLHTVILRLRVAKNEFQNKISVIYGCKYEYHTTRYSQSMERHFSDSLYDYYTTTLKNIDPRLVYVFTLEDEDGLHYFSEAGVTENYDFSLAYFDCFQLPFISNSDIHKPVPWMKKAVFYQIFVDRFCYGDKSKDNSYITMDWGEIPTPLSFAGGDIVGIQEKLNYIRDLGANVLYLTPVFLSPSNHKYDPIDYTEVDPQFGSNEIFKDLIDKAHSMDIRIVLDVVFNHCSKENALFLDVIKNGRKSPYHDWFLINGDYPDTSDINYMCFGISHYMPKWNTSNPAVQEYLIGIAIDWTRNFGIDGWRLDVSDEVSHEMWRNFRKAVKTVNPDCVIIGENWHDARPYLLGDQFDSVMHYGFTKACLDFFAFETLNANEMANRLNSLLVRNTDVANSMMLNLLDSHDTERFFTRVSEDVDKLLCALALAICFIGAPCIYYGTEVGMVGKYDPDCRRTFPWDTKKWNMDIMNTVKQLLEIKQLLSLQTGDIRIECEQNLLTVKRDSITLYINQSGNAQSVWGEAILSRHYQHNMLQHGGFCILKRGKEK